MTSASEVLNLCGAPGVICKALLERRKNLSIDLFTIPLTPHPHGNKPSIDCQRDAASTKLNKVNFL